MRVAVLAGLVALSAMPAAGFILDFNAAGLPPGVDAYGNAARLASGGTGNSGALRLTDAVPGQSGSLVVGSLTGGTAVSTFDVAFDVFCGDGGGDPAEGFSFCWGTNLPNGPWDEEGTGSGLIVSFDTHTDPGEPGREVTVTMNNVLAGRVAFDAHNGAWTFIHIRLRPGGLLDVKHGNTILFAGLPLSGFIERNGPRYGWGAATAAGANISRQWLDNILINAQPIMVTKGSDSGAGTLRAAMATALAQPGPDQIRFASSLDGQKITLTSGLISTGAQTVVVDAASLPNGITLSGGGTSRIFHAIAGSELTLGALTLSGGAAPGGNGGAIFNQGTLSMHRCTLTGNTAGEGGGLDNAGTAALSLCTLAANTAAGGNGGALHSYGPLSLTECTISGNSATFVGGAVFSFSPLTVTGSIIAGNSAQTGADIHNEGTLTRAGANLIQIYDADGGGTDSGPPAIAAAPQLLPLGHYGGPTLTMLPRATSPALDRIVTSPFSADQRGLPRVMWGLADLGAVEAGISAECAWEVREIFRSPATAVQSLNDALALAADPAATVVSGTTRFLNRHDPDAPGSGGFFSAEEPFASNNLTPQGLTDGNDNDFVTVARTFIEITEEDDYTFGFSSSEGARLRVFGASFGSSTRLNANNPANPAHSGDTLSYPGLSGNADTLGVCLLRPGIYAVEFLTWERDGGAHCEVFAARGARTVVDSSFRLIGEAAPGGTLDPGSEPVTVYSQNFTGTGGGWTVTNVNAPFEGPWTYNAALGTWTTAGQGGMVLLSPSTTLTSPLITATCTGEALFYFTHRHSFEGPAWDGGQLRASINGGTFDVLPGSAFLENGYLTGRVDPTSTADLRGQEAFIGDSASYVTSFSTSAASLGVLETGDTVRLQFLASYDNSLRRSDPAWEIDLVRLAQACSLASGWDISVIRNGAASLNDALTQVFAHWSGTPQPNTVSVGGPILHYYDPEAGGGGHGLPQAPFPGNLPGNDDNFALGARSTLRIAAAGDYTFCLLCDDGARLRISGSRDWSVSSPNATQTQPLALPDGFQTASGGADVFGRVSLTPGTYEIEVIYNEISGPAYLSLWGAAGSHTAWHPRIFGLLGGPGPTVGPPALSTAPQPGLPARPVHDDFAAALPLSNSSARAVSCNQGATSESGEPSGSGSGKSVWWAWTAPASGVWRADTAGSSFDTVLDVFTGNDLMSLTAVASDDNDGGGVTSLACFSAVQGTAYHFRVRGSQGAEGTILFNLTPSPPPANDAFASPVSLGSAASLVTSANNCGATAQAGEPAHASAANGSLWFTWTAPFAGDFIVDTSGSAVDTALAVYTGATLNSLTLVAANDDSAPGIPQSRLTFRAAAGTAYRIAVDGATATDRGAVRLNITHQPAVVLHTLTHDALPAATRRLLLRWRSEPFVTYRIEQSSDLDAWTAVRTRVASEGALTDVELTGLPDSTERLFFRVARE